MNAFKPYPLRDDFTLKNRLVMAPMTTYSSQDDFHVSEEELHYYKLRSKTMGMVIIAATSINDQAQAFDKQITLKSDDYIPSMARLAKAIKEEGAKAIVQLHHGGRMNNPTLYENKEDIVSASAVPAPREGMVTPRALTEEEIHQTIEDFAQATRRSIEAGYDGVELHGANTYLLQQFFSPHSNRRTDAFGGSLTKRMHFIDMLIDRVNEVIKHDATEPFILGYRFSPEEIEDPGITLNDTLALVDMLKDKPLDYLHISLGKYDQSSMRDQTDQEPIAQKIQTVLKRKIPFIGVGKIETRESIDHALSLGYDLVASGMPILVDPNWGETIQLNQPIKTVMPDTLPKPLYDRLAKYRERFQQSGYEFPVEND